MRLNQLGLIALILSAAPIGAMAQNLTIDDFTTGSYLSPNYISGTWSNTSSQNGSMMGGNRTTNMNVCDPTNCSVQNPYQQPSAYGFFPKSATQPAAMVQTAGYYAGPRIDMGYGFGVHMDEYFAGYQKIRVSFQSLTEPLNFNIQLFTGTSWAQGGCNINAYSAPFVVELPLNKFVVTKGFDFVHVNLLDFIFQSSSAIGGVSFGITKIELANDTVAGLVIPCHY
jgi:hypothetical protein